MKQALLKITIGLLAMGIFYHSTKAQVFTMDGSNIMSCDGFFMDSGGSDANYGSNEFFQTTLCPDNSGKTNISLQFSGPDLALGDQLSFFDGPDTLSSLLKRIDITDNGLPFIINATAANPSGCITVVFRSNGREEAAGWSAIIKCIDACQSIEAVLLESIPLASPLDTGWIDICPGETVEFRGSGVYAQDGLVYNHSDFTSIFKWTFGDGTSALGPVVRHNFQEPGGYTVQLEIQDQFGCTNTNFISQRVRVSSKPKFSIGSNFPGNICLGDTINLEAAVNSVPQGASLLVKEDTLFFQNGALRSDSLALPDGDGRSYSESIYLSGFPPGKTLTDINDLLGISINAEHSWLRDLEISLKCPNGDSVILHNHVGKTGSEVFLGEPIEGDLVVQPGKGFDYYWRPDANNPSWLNFVNTVNLSTLPPGSYQSAEPLDKLLDCPLNGEWTINIKDLWADDNGIIFSWGVELASHLFSDLESFSPTIQNFGWLPSPDIINQNNNSMEALPARAGSNRFQFFVEDDFGCTYDTSLQIMVAPSNQLSCLISSGPDGNLDLQDTTICRGDSIQLDVSLNFPPQSAIVFERFPAFAIGHSNHPHGQAYEDSIRVSNIFPNILSDPQNQISSICLNLETDWAEDIHIYLRSPSGNLLELSTDNGGSEDNYTNTCFSPNATDPITGGAAPFTGTFIPEGDWSILENSEINGFWTIMVSDGSGDNELGLLNSWSITFNTENNIQYSWTPAQNISCTNCSTPIFSTKTTSTYYLRISDNQGDEVIDSFTLNVNACTVNSCPISGELLNISNPSCDEMRTRDVQLTANGGQAPFLFEVNDSISLMGDTVLFSNLSPGLYTIIISDQGGCLDTLSLNLQDLEELKLDSVQIQDVNCFGGNSGTATAFASGGSAPYQYLWDDPLGQVGVTATRLEAGNYNLTVTDSNNCQIDTQITILEPNPLLLDLTKTDVSCAGNANGRVESMVSGGQSPYFYNWNNGQNTAFIDGLSSGVYRVTVTDNNGCQIQEEIIVEEPSSSLQLTLEQTKMACFGEKNNEARAIISGGQFPYQYLWSDGQASDLVTGLDTFFYAVTVSDGNGCFISDSLLIEDLDPLNPNIIISPPSCNEVADGALGINFVEGGSNANLEDYVFQWNNGQSGSFIDGLTGGVEYTVTVTDPIGCVAEASRVMTAAIEINYETDITPISCFGANDGKIELSNLQGNGSNFTIRWDILSGGSGNAASNLSAGNYSFTITDAANCSTEGRVEITQPPPIIINFESQNIDCFNNMAGSASATVQGGVGDYTYRWSTQDTGTSISNLTAGNYTLRVTDGNGCVEQRSISIEEPSPFQITYTTKMPTCAGDRNGAVTLEVDGGVPPYQFSLDNNNFQLSNSFLGLLAGRYNIFVKDANGCQSFETATLVDPPPLIIQASPQNVRIEIGQSVNLEAIAQNGKGNIQYFWKAPYAGTLSCTDCPNPVSSPQNTLTYELSGTDEDGCIGTDFLTVFVEKPKVVLVPTGFTPNDDGLNDRLIVHGDDQTLIRSYQVFDRWGSLIFSANNFMANDEANGWDGRIKNQTAANGVYVWIVEAEFSDGSSEVFKGQSSLIR